MALRIVAQLGLDGSQFASGLRGAEARVARFSSSLHSVIGGRMAALFSVGAMGMAIRSTVALAGELTDLAARAGISVEALQRMGLVARQNGSDIEELVRFYEQLNSARDIALRNPKGEQGIAFAQLGISQAQLRTSSADDLRRAIERAWAKSETTEALVGPLRKVGGRGAMEVAAALSAGLDSASENVRVMSDDQAEILDSLSDQWEEFRTQFLIDIVPVLTKALNFFRDLKDNLVTMMAIGGGFIGATKRAAKETAGDVTSGKIINPFRILPNFFRKFFDASKAEWEKIYDIAAGVVAEREADDAAAAAQRAAKIAARSRNKPTFAPFELAEEETRKAFSPLISGPGVGIGNFLGVARVVDMVREKELRHLESIDRATTSMAKSLESRDDVGLID